MRRGATTERRRRKKRRTTKGYGGEGWARAKKLSQRDRWRKSFDKEQRGGWGGGGGGVQVGKYNREGRKKKLYMKPFVAGQELDGSTKKNPNSN